MAMSKRSLWLAAGMLSAGLIAVTAGDLEAQDDTSLPNVKIVTLKDGRSYEGVVTETDEGIEVQSRKGIIQHVPREAIQSIRDAVRPKDAYLARKADVDANDAKALYDLARWVWETHDENKVLLLHARDDLQAALAIDPDDTRAKLLLRQVQAKILSSDQGPSRPPSDGTAAIREEDLVTERDILWIRLRELRPSDRDVRIQYKNKVLRRYIDQMRGREIEDWDRHGNEEHFLAQPRITQVLEILRNKRDDTELLRDIEVKTDPAFMTEFRSRVWPILQNSCAAASCHGGPKPKRGLKFFVAPGINVRADYTNFLIVSGWRKGDRCLLDRQDMERSLILQYGLNRKVTQTSHPTDIPPVFTGIRSRKYRQILDWMKSLKSPLAPDYHIHAGYRPAGMQLHTSGTPIFPSEPAEK